MKVKKYKASSMQEAMNQVRAELGDEAVILNSKAVKTSKFFGLVTKKGVEVIAAVDEEPIKHNCKLHHVPDMEPPKQQSIVQQEQFSFDISSQKELIENIQEMKRMMKGLKSANNRDSQLPDHFFDIEESLQRTELPVDLSEAASEYLYQEWLKSKTMSKRQMRETLKHYFMERIEQVDFEGNVYRKKFISLVGPTGVGKTTTLAKLAANAVLKHGKSVGFITTDTYRIAAIEQLKTYASILDAPIEVCYNAEDFQVAKRKLAHLDLVFIDTAGRNFLNEEFVRDLQEVIDFKAEMTTFLVLSLTSKMTDMKKITDQFWKVGIQQFIFTKKDETAESSSMYAMIEHYKIGAAFITNGQSVPEDLQVADKDLVITDLIEEIKK
ncbi:flagellar biosynthesis protein FlhF [Bacillus tianshenii]|uniref:Flagellar biosynthesis protein FlhF n=1 Tax=Sutcliffiella tianshenii TaxID=1463404 RepID=A0ABS2NWG9_9BACI|nr:flagellar biosynthesis protein FlhF [Bacillus tianshenii]MBM7619005.1 flagellar biosynthesis protein FlhF [Bacillus tianshenii]